MRTTTSEPTGCEIEILNDLTGAWATTWSPRTRAEIIETFLFKEGREPEQDDPGPLVCCFHFYRDRIVWHFFAVPGKEAEAMAELRKGVCDDE